MEAKNIDRATTGLRTIFQVSKDNKTKVITLKAETPSPELSQQIVKRATDLLNQFVVSNNRTRGSEKADYAASRLSEARHEMDLAENTLRTFLESNRNFLTSSEPAVRLKGARLEAELNLRRQLVVTLAMNREQSLLDAKNDVPILNILDQGNLPIEKSRPSRAAIVIMWSMIAGLSTWAWNNRQWIRDAIANDHRENHKTTEES